MKKKRSKIHWLVDSVGKICNEAKTLLCSTHMDHLQQDIKQKSSTLYLKLFMI